MSTLCEVLPRWFYVMVRGHRSRFCLNLSVDELVSDVVFLLLRRAHGAPGALDQIINQPLAKKRAQWAILDCIRRNYRYREFECLVEPSVLADGALAPRSLDPAIERCEYRRCFLEYTQQITESEWDLLNFKIGHRLSDREIANLTEVSHATVHRHWQQLCTLFLHAMDYDA